MKSSSSGSRPKPAWWFVCSTLAASAAALPAVTPQDPALPARAATDPYTNGDAAALARAGYVSLGPFDFGSNHDTVAIQALLPSEPLLWIETAHFRIGAALSPCRVDGDKEAGAKLEEELQRLSQRLPSVKPDVKALDPWLRAHLVAQRVEDTYAEVSRVLGVTDADFPLRPGSDPRRPTEFMGLGPYLGMPQKFTILLLRESASLERYTAAHHGWATIEPTRYHDHRFGTAFFGAAESSSRGLLRDDLVLRTHLAFNVSWLLYVSYRSFGHNLPAWITNGLAHWHARQVTTKVPVYDLEPGDAGRMRYEQWSKRWLSMLRARAFEPLPALFTRMDVNTFTMDQHLQCWALVDHLLACHRPQFVKFLNRMKDPFHERLRFPTLDELQARQQQALQQAFGVDAAGLEETWRRQPVTKSSRR